MKATTETRADGTVELGRAVMYIYSLFFGVPSLAPLFLLLLLWRDVLLVPGRVPPLTHISLSTNPIGRRRIIPPHLFSKLK